MDKTARWPGDTPGRAAYDWAEISIPGVQALEDGELTRIRFNVSWLLSSWACIFGKGCPGVLITGAMEDRGCCQIGVHLTKGDDLNRVNKYVKQLTDEDLDANLLADIKKNGWKVKERDPHYRDVGHTAHTRIVDGACVLANRASGSTGKLGCSLHVLANRLGIHPSETKPDICWQIPMSVTDEYNEKFNQTTITVDASTGSVWGGTEPAKKYFPAWWCVETPDAYGPNAMVDSSTLVFRTMEVELRKMMGDAAYEAMAAELEDIMQTGGRRRPMPGETVAGGRPLIPLIVKDRIADWANDTDPDSQEHSREALGRSAEYIFDHGIFMDTAPTGPPLIAGHAYEIQISKPSEN
jgi:hypothetical protein